MGRFVANSPVADDPHAICDASVVRVFPADFTGSISRWEPPNSPQLSMEKFACPAIGERCRGGVVVTAIMPSEGMNGLDLYGRSLEIRAHLWAEETLTELNKILKR